MSQTAAQIGRNAEMLKGERSVFKIAPEFSYAQKGCLLNPPGGVSRDAALMLDIQLVNFYRKSEVKAVGEDGVILRTLKASQSWEHPRPPFEVNSRKTRAGGDVYAAVNNLVAYFLMLIGNPRPPAGEREHQS